MMCCKKCRVNADCDVNVINLKYVPDEFKSEEDKEHNFKVIKKCPVCKEEEEVYMDKINISGEVFIKSQNVFNLVFKICQ